MQAVRSAPGIRTMLCRSKNLADFKVVSRM